MHEIAQNQTLIKSRVPHVRKSRHTQDVPKPWPKRC